MSGFNRDKIIVFLDRLVLFFICAGVFFLPISNAIIESASISAIVFYIISRCVARKFMAFDSVNVAVLLYFCVCALSVVFSSNVEISVRALFFKLLQNLLFFLIIADIVRTPARLKAVLYVFLASALLLGIDGIYQYFTHVDFLRHRALYGLPRISGPYRISTDFGSYLATIIPLVICSFGYFRSALARLFLGALSLLLLTCVIMTVSRGAWFAVLISFVFVCFWVRKAVSVAMITSSAFFLLAVSYFFPGTFISYRLQNIFSFVDVSSIDRLIIWQITYKMIETFPLLGTGLGTFMFYFHKIGQHYPQKDIVPYAHNCYLQIMAETGILGFAAFIAIVAVVFYKGAQVLKSTQRGPGWYMILIFFSGAVAFLVQMAVDTSLYSLSLGILFWMVLGLGLGAVRSSRVLCEGRIK